MKLPFQSKSRDVLCRKPLITPAESGGASSTYSSGFGSDEAVHTRSNVYPVHQVGWEVEVNDGPRHKRISSLVKKMSCASKKEKHEEESMERAQPRRAGPRKPQGSWRVHFQHNGEAKRERPVLITVKEGEVTHLHTSAASQGQGQRQSRTSALRTSLSRTDRNAVQQKRTRDVETRRTSQTDQVHQINLLYRHGATAVHQKRIAAPAATSRSAKWRDGGEAHWKRDGNIPSLMFDDESTVGEDALSVGGFTGLTGVTDYSSATGYTTEATEPSDESDDNLKASAEQKGKEKKQLVGTRSSHINYAKLTANTLLKGVAEDLGIIAGFVIMDGRECFNCVAETTTETVYSCKPEPLLP